MDYLDLAHFLLAFKFNDAIHFVAAVDRKGAEESFDSLS